MTFVNVDNPKGPLNGFQRRLVHQLVRSEFPQCRCFARSDGSFMQVEMIDHDREARACSSNFFNPVIAFATEWFYDNFSFFIGDLMFYFTNSA